MSSLENREFKISNGNNKNDFDIEYNLKLTSSVPIMNFSDGLVDNLLLDSFTVKNEEPNNKPYDVEMDDRFKFILEFKSLQRDISSVVYYDKKYNDFIVFPNPDLIDVSNIKNKVYHITSFTIGSNKPDVKFGTGYEISIQGINKVSLPEPDKTIENYDGLLLNVPGIYNGFKQRIRKNLSTGVVMYKDVNMVLFLKIKTSDLYTNSVKLPVSTLVPDSEVKFRVEYNSLKELDNIYIPITV